MTPIRLPGLRRRRIAAAGSLTLAFVNITGAVFLLAPTHHSFLREALGGSAPGAPRFLLLLSGLLLLAVIPGLLQAKRMAFVLACVAALGSLALHPLLPRSYDDPGALLSIVVLFGLVGSARAFPARSDPVRLRQGLYWLVGGECVVFVIGLIGLYFIDREFVELSDLPEALRNALRLLFVLPATSAHPVMRHGQHLIEAIRALSLMVIAISAWHLVHPVLNRALARPNERQRVRQILNGHATTALAQFHLLDDKTYFFSEDGEAFLSYRMVGATAVVLGEPVGPRDSARAAAAEFVHLCALNGWRFGFHQVTARGADDLARLGLRKLKIGEEAIVPVQTFALAGKSFKHLRNSQSALERAGYAVEELGQPIAGPTMDALREVSDAWLADGGHRERSFTLGAFSPDYLRESRVFVVRRPAGRIEAFTNVVPRFQSADGTFDLMRRRPDSPNGVMDLLLVHLIEIFRAEGCAGLNLGLAPLANIEGGGPVAAALRLLYERGNAAFNFKGLRFYKDKWHPRWEDRFLVYRSDVDVLAVAIAVARAGEDQSIVGQLARSGVDRAGRLLKPVLRASAPNARPALS